MSPAQSFLIVILAVCLAIYCGALARWRWLEWKERRAERKRRERIDEWEWETWG